MPYYVLFDTETTGNSDKDRIIQIGAMIIRDKKPIEVYDEMCSADVPISYEAMEVHNITPDMIADKPLYSQIGFSSRIDELNKKENYLIAHNISFDLGMLEKEGFDNHFTKIDTVRCSKHLFPDLPHHRLQYLRYALGLYRDEEAEGSHLGVSIKAHDAIGDVLVMKLLFSRLIKETKRLFHDSDPIEKLVELTNTPVMIKKFKFGKYKGKEIKKIAVSDIGYIRWMRNNLDLDEDMVFTLDHYLR